MRFLYCLFLFLPSSSFAFVSSSPVRKRNAMISFVRAKSSLSDLPSLPFCKEEATSFVLPQLENVGGISGH